MFGVCNTNSFYQSMFFADNENNKLASKLLLNWFSIILLPVLLFSDYLGLLRVTEFWMDSSYFQSLFGSGLTLPVKMKYVLVWVGFSLGLTESNSLELL